MDLRGHEHPVHSNQPQVSFSLILHMKAPYWPPSQNQAICPASKIFHNWTSPKIPDLLVTFLQKEPLSPFRQVSGLSSPQAALIHYFPVCLLMLTCLSWGALNSLSVDSRTSHFAGATLPAPRPSHREEEC